MNTIKSQFSGDDFKSICEGLIKDDELAMHQLMDSLGSITWEYSQNEDGDTTLIMKDT